MELAVPFYRLVTLKNNEGEYQVDITISLDEGLPEFAHLFGREERLRG